ncbi:hypothetical protein NP233_g556 [Leucocoprinus birnbaumii]|uniref:DUF6533 domain-containing protein n=1 Tax=Leucocoprinus birnbaumii TaxID=56174 RepID=A0AAD5W456_9AGAR|nr:hypothetical protein NP233_g556 [Leucocoprinus birnbaumii]
MSLSDADLKVAIEDVQQLLFYHYAAGAALAIFIFDYALTFSREVELVWASRWTLVKMLFLLNRYLVVPTMITHQFYLGMMGICLSGTTSCLRVWVLWDRDRRIFIGIESIIVVTMGIQFFLSFNWFKSDEYNFRPISEQVRVTGCVFHTQITSPFRVWLIQLLPEATAVISAFRFHRMNTAIFGSSDLLKEVYFEGVLFPLYQSIICLSFPIYNRDYTFLPFPVCIVLWNILSSRMILHIRQSALKASGDLSSMTVSFRTGISFLSGTEEETLAELANGELVLPNMCPQSAVPTAVAQNQRR